jgi:2-dehydropantoate 2-reductase
MQNGIGNEEWLSQFTQKAPIVCGITFIGAYRDGIDLDISFLGNIKLAPYGLATLQTCEYIRDLFHKSPIDLPITLHEHYKEIRWQKLLWNIPFGALSIIFDKSTHLLAHDEPYRTMSAIIMTEISIIAKADGVAITQKMQDDMMAHTAKAGYYLPTIYRDFQAGNLIEKEYLFDNVLTIGKQHQCIVPFLTLIEKQLQTLSERSLKKQA